MQTVDTIADLEALYDAPAPASLTKVAHQLTPLYHRWISAARFVVVSTVGAGGTDGSPRGDDGPVVHVQDAQTLLLPDWRGNNRLDTLRNIVADGRISLMFMVPGENNVVRVNGRAVLAVDPALTAQFEQGGKHPRSVVVITIEELYFQCAKAIMRSAIWADADKAAVPTAGEFLREQLADFDAKSYDAAYPEYAKSKMW
ncbi:pyridoxamine 5'-phosphate oxidase family protein [Octadecabacter sp. R77987]|uniref:pyridoxamine 5'-phosphate oxidase family protein n=1 Tax=Octadecabacter sp. R77987 TaxID=3093874 RepID=UPI00366BC0BC